MSHEVEAGEWLLKHGDEVIKSVQDRINPNYKLLPDFAYDLYLEGYENEVFNCLKKAVMESLNLNADQMDLFYNKKYVKMLLGEKVFSP